MYRPTVAHQGNEKYQIYFPVISWHSSSFSYLDYYRLSDIARNAMLWALLGPPCLFIARELAMHSSLLPKVSVRLSDWFSRAHRLGG